MDNTAEIANLKQRLDKLEGKGTAVVVALVLDKSGSMKAMKSEAISGYNEFVNAQRAATPDVDFVFTQFDTDVKTPEVAKMGKARNLTNSTYQPDGFTALYDAISDTIDKVKDLKPKRAVICVISDGEENASHRTTLEALLGKIKAVQKKKWQFTFIGADIDAYSIGKRLNIPAASVLSVRGGAGLSAGYGAMGQSVSSYTTGVADSVDYDDKTKTKVETPH